MTFVRITILHLLLFRRYANLLLNTGVALLILVSVFTTAAKTPGLTEIINYPLIILMAVNFTFIIMASHLFCGGWQERKSYVLSGNPDMKRVIYAKNAGLIAFISLLTVVLIVAEHLVTDSPADYYRQALLYGLCTFPLLLITGTFSSVYLVKKEQPGLFEMFVIGFCFMAAHVPYIIAVYLLSSPALCVIFFISESVYWFVFQVPRAAGAFIRKNYNLPVQ